MLEVCAYTIQTCRVAEAGGAARIELCANAAEGGVTPGYGTIKHVIEHVGIPAYVMIRPRGGNFIYDADELAIMYRDIAVCRELGCPGIVAGILRHDKTVDTEAMLRIVELAGPMKVTFHKAFDRTPDAQKALEDVIATGCERILTSGLMPTATEGAELLQRLQRQAGSRIIIMPGGGVRSGNIVQLAAETGCREFHSSCLTSRSEGYIADKEEVLAIVRQLSSAIV